MCSVFSLPASVLRTRSGLCAARLSRRAGRRFAVGAAVSSRGLRGHIPITSRRQAAWGGSQGNSGSPSRFPSRPLRTAARLGLRHRGSASAAAGGRAAAPVTQHFRTCTHALSGPFSESRGAFRVDVGKHAARVVRSEGRAGSPFQFLS